MAGLAILADHCPGGPMPNVGDVKDVFEFYFFKLALFILARLYSRQF